MDLATGINLTTRTADTVTNTGTNRTACLPLAKLSGYGLPRYMTKEIELTFNLQDLNPCSFEEYAYAWSFTEAADAQHAAWTLRAGGHRLVIPALAILRGLIGNNPDAFERLFMPQSLEDMCIPSAQGPSSTPANCHFVLPNVARLREEMARRLTWFYCFPSARASWASVYNLSRAGKLGLSLPDATITCRLDGHGLKGSKTNVYVTAVHIRELTANERPFEFALGTACKFEFLGEKRARGTRREAPPEFCIPARNNEHQLDDSEWRAVVAHLTWLPSSYMPERRFLDAVLNRMGTNVLWCRLEEASGATKGAYLAQFKRWRMDGRLEQVLNIVRKVRAETASH